jgi:hypothetical protein
MRTRKLILIGFVCLFVVLFWYWRSYITYDGEVSHFEAKVRQKVDPAQLQAWALDLLQQYSSSNNNYIHVFPAYIKDLSSRHYSGVVSPQGYVHISWSGLGDGWGLDIGPTNFDGAGTGKEMWRPGIYFWRQ